VQRNIDSASTKEIGCAPEGAGAAKKKIIPKWP